MPSLPGLRTTAVARRRTGSNGSAATPSYAHSAPSCSAVAPRTASSSASGAGSSASCSVQSAFTSGSSACPSSSPRGPLSSERRTCKEVGAATGEAGGATPGAALRPTAASAIGTITADDWSGSVLPGPAAALLSGTAFTEAYGVRGRVSGAFGELTDHQPDDRHHVGVVDQIHLPAAFAA